MQTGKTKNKKFTDSITFKAMIIALLTLLMLIPNAMIKNLIWERQDRSYETIQSINRKWSSDQTVCGPVLAIPYSVTTRDNYKRATTTKHTFYLTPEELNIKTKLYPEERYYGIYKTVVYRSEIVMDGKFGKIEGFPEKSVEIFWDKAYLDLGFSDLRGIGSNIVMNFNGKEYGADAGATDDFFDALLTFYLKDSNLNEINSDISFHSRFSLNGSSSIHFIPIGKISNIEVEGEWKDPGFTGNFTPNYKLDDKGFKANWNILYYNRNIPDSWSDTFSQGYSDNFSFGVNLVNPVDHYQQNMRSAKYALLFILLTFVTFFFIEILFKKKIHPLQYLLVGAALILFYALLLSISEFLSFGFAYLIAGTATILLISLYSISIFKNLKQSIFLFVVLIVLYLFLYIILQLEQSALLIGSVGIFFILGIIMFFSRKINWYKEATDLPESHNHYNS